jgi:hypothetical protein
MTFLYSRLNGNAYSERASLRCATEIELEPNPKKTTTITPPGPKLEIASWTLTCKTDFIHRRSWMSAI